MSITAITSERTVPVAEDLTTEETRLSVLRGLESMFRKDIKVAEGAEFDLGEWAVLNADGKVERPGITPVAQSYLVFAGTNRFDAHATGQVTLIFNSNVEVKSSQYDKSETYNVGDSLTVKDLGGGEAVVTKATGTEPRLAMVTGVGSDYLQYAVVPATNVPA